jgi:putative tricarboxylic transport membrane protein
VTPIARLTNEYEAIAVPADSPFRSLDDLLSAWRENPRSVAIAGGSAGCTDHILAGLVAKAAGIKPKDVNYVGFSGGGEAWVAILGGKVAAGISGVGEFREQVNGGELRVLAVSSPERIEGVFAETLVESGVDVVLANWRGLVAPPGISESDRSALINLVSTLPDSPGRQHWPSAAGRTPFWPAQTSRCSSTTSRRASEACYANWNSRNDGWSA